MRGKLVQKIWQSNPAIYAPAKYKRACRYDVFIPDRIADIEFTMSATLTGLVSEAEGAIRALNAAGGNALGPLARLLLRTESIASSKVEGMQLGVRELARAEAKTDSGQKVGTTAAEVLANIDAMVLAVDEGAAASTFDIDQITAIHRRLMERATNAKIAGVIRTNQNWIGGNDYNPCGADYVPPPPEEVEPLLQDLCADVNADLLSPLVQAAIVHAQFETIHPFADGNGRTGRALVHVVLKRRGIAPYYVPPISVAIAATRSRYIDALTSFRFDSMATWIEYFADATARSAHLAKRYLEAVQALRSRWEAKVRQLPEVPRADSTVWEVIEVLPAHPMITVPIAAAATKRSKPATYQAFEILQQAGVLVPTSTGRRNQSWEAEGLLDLIADLEDGTLDEASRSEVRSS
ncbi:MAG: Fic family protein [Gemmatimonadaceae bacterium]|jgi:Fic family protein|nr:Fic family protein [Gemmatimonadaceae bacterium]